MCVESTIPLVMESITAPEAVIPVHQARSHDELRSPDLNFTVYTAMTIVSQMEGSGRPECGEASETLRSSSYLPSTSGWHG